MAQTPAKRDAAGDMIDYTPVSDVTAGDVILLGTLVLVALSDIAAGVLGALCARGVFWVPKVAAQSGSAGDAIYWDVDGSPNGGTALSGAASTSSGVGNLMGWLVKDAASNDAYYLVNLNPSKRTATIAGSVTADDITGTDSSLGINGLAAAQGGAVAIAGGTSSTGGNAGGAVSLTGGTPGATGVGGAASVVGAAGGATSGTGGAANVTGGAGTNGNANGGAVNINGGAKNGSGTDGAVNIGTSNTSAINLGKMPRIPTATVAAAGTVQSDAAAITEGFTLVTGSTNAGVKLPSAVAGMQVIIKNNVGGNMKVWPNTSDAINAITADSAFTMATLTSCLFVAYDATTWYTIPLVAS